MPLLTLHLLQLKRLHNVLRFLEELRATDPQVEIVVASKPRYLVVRPTIQDVSILTETEFDLMLLLHAPHDSIPDSMYASIEKEYKLTVGIPSKILSTYPEKNKKLLVEASHAGLTGSLDNPTIPQSSQNLELSPDLLRFMRELENSGPVTMLNLLNFKPDGKPSYYQYGQNFIEVARKRGGDAKIVGNVVKSLSTATNPRTTVAEAETWQEIAIVHYASIKHFCDMLAGADYQAINEKYRLPALADTLLLCTTEIDLNQLGRRAKL